MSWGPQISFCDEDKKLDDINSSSEDIAARMEAFQPKVTAVMEAYLTNPWTLTNLTHGDAWYNNFLYRCGDLFERVTSQFRIKFKIGFGLS
jgi:hypothetical protein